MIVINKYNIRDSQAGATLIIVLVFLILIMLVGAIAVRQSVTDLKIATTDQVDALLLNAADSVPAHLEKAINDGGAEYTSLVDSALGPFGHFMGEVGKPNRGNQVIFCYNPRARNFYSIERTTILAPNGGSIMTGGAGNGYCDSTNADSYTSDRRTAMVQVMVKWADTSAFPQQAFEGVPLGRDASIDGKNNEQPLFEIHSVAILPALSNVSDATINECFQLPNAEVGRFVSGQNDAGDDERFTQTISECFEQAGIPSKVVVEYIRLADAQNAKICTKVGKGTGTLAAGC